ncbi:Ger(x)C family spore germination protein [Paenibacillus rhizovicinus]|uniref:Ger(X)C family spore germination protein n=1 Tax=Paenibacillus rhizovicinus TaxID=2704463 RepID=A0A6C0NU41_9BACL|nr:Ger(x)C family spore germination protein [Paenibacillus rhizovicinus]QHW29739.1 Ger(x)C family spore germination protein [Paenibacillus rhizovicinus]
MRNKGIRIVAIASLLSFGLTGCWDRVEINKRGFVVGVALDQTRQQESQEKDTIPGTNMRGTFQFVVPAGLKTSSGGTGQGAAAGRGYFNLGVVESSMAALTAMLAARTSRSPYYEHLKLIIISKDIARDDSKFSDVLDFFLRGKEMRRDMHVLIAENEASDVLNVKPLNENYPISYIESTITNVGNTNYMLHASRLGDIHECLLRKNSFTIQNVRMTQGAIMLTGAALFDGNEHRMLGELNGENTQGLNFLTDQVKGGIVETAYKDKSIAFEIIRASRKIKLVNNDNGKLKFAVTINTEGTFVKSAKDVDLNDPAVFNTMEKRFETEIVRVANITLKTLQQTYKKDAMGLGMYLFENHYRTWKKVEPDWEQGRQLFAEAEIEVSAHVKIRRIGDIDESERG